MVTAAEFKKARDRLHYAKRVGKAPRPADVKLVRDFKAVKRPDLQDTGPTRTDPEAVSVTSGENASSGSVPPPSSTDAGLGGAIPELPAPDVSASSAGPEGHSPNPESSAGEQPNAGQAGGPAAPSSGPAPDAAGALPALYRGLLMGLNQAAQTRGCWFTLPEASIDVLTLYAAEVLAPYEAMVNKPALVLGAPVVLGVQILVHDAMAKKKKAKEDRERRAAMGLDPDPPPPPPAQAASTNHAPPPAPEPEAPAPETPAAPKRSPLGWAT